MKITANQIIELLAIKHSKEVFVPECKNGPTHSGSHDRMDAWVMYKSWAHPKVVAYEVKVSRQDFLNDTKWRNYLNYCNELYFVCPPGLIEKSELPAEAGLIYTSKNAKKLFTKKKSVYRDIDIPEEVFRYVLMCRAVITDYQMDLMGNRHAYWEAWLKRKEKGAELGYEVSEKIRKKVSQVNQENMELKRQMLAYDNIIKRVIEMGFNPDKSVSTWEVERKLKEFKTGLPEDFSRTISSAINYLSDVRKVIG